MPLWRCPHCATPQPESSRCWLCGRSTTTCAACRHYRRAVAGGLGLCGLNPRRLALRGTEVRPCWEAVPPVDAGLSVRELAGVAPRGREDPGERPHRTFVLVDELRAAPGGTPRAVAPAPPTDGIASARWSLWGDPDA